MPQVGINIGSNLGDRRAHLRYAIAELQRLTGCTTCKVSAVYETKAWGYLSDSPFFNVGLELCTELSPEQMLDICQSVEAAGGSSPHRTPEGGYADRELDIDIVYYGNRCISTPRLTLPHPRLQDRGFVLLPLAELSPQWKHPVLGKTAECLLAELSQREDLYAKKTLL